MKKNQKSLLTLAVMSFGLLLNGCSINNSNVSESTNTASNTSSTSLSSSSSSTLSSSSSSSENNSSSSTSPVIVEVEKKFSITVNAAEGTSVSLSNPQEDGYSAGSTVNFTVSVEKVNLELDAVKYDGQVCYPNSEGVYSIIVLNKDAAIETSVVARGAENLLEVSDVNPDDVPKNPAALKAALENARVAESRYLASATYESTYNETRSLTAVVGHNDVVEVEGKYLPSSTSPLTNYERLEKGIVGNDYYEVEESTASVNYSKTASIKHVVSNDTETLLANQIKESDAKLQASTSGFIDTVLEEFFGTTTSFVPTDNYGWKEIKLSSEVSEDNKYYSVTATAYYSSYDKFYTFVAKFDGDNFLTNVDCEVLDYKYSDVETYTVTEGEGDDATEVTYHRPKEGAEPDSVQNMDIDFVRGYRSRLMKTDLSNAATSDYDVDIDYRVTGGDSGSVGEDGIIYNSAQMMFKFRQKEVKPIFFLPTFVGAKEDGFITYDSYNTPVVSDVGEFTLLFDNGIGEIKEVPLTSVRPVAKSMTASLSSSTIYNGESVTLTSAITPAGADQAVNVSLKEGSTAEVELTENEDGTWNVKGVTNGQGTLVVTSIANENLTKEIEFVVDTKPTAADIMAFLTTYTLKADLGYYGKHYLNFNADGNGSWNVDDYGWGTAISFTWSLDEDTFVLTINDAPIGKCKGYNLISITEISKSSAILTVDYYGSEKTGTLVQEAEKYEDLNNI